MTNIRNWIIGSAIVMFLAAGGKALATDGDIPDGVSKIIMLILGAGIGIEPATGLLNKIAGKKTEEAKE